MRSLGFLFFMLFLAGFALVMLQGRQTTESVEPPRVYDIADLYDRRWRPTSIDGDAVPEDTDMFFRVAPDGEVDGFAGCNSFFGTMEEADGGYKMGPFGATRKACDQPIMSREFALLRVLELSRTFNATPDDLEIVDETGAVLGTFVAIL